jgi:hypothetical protein
LHGAYGNSVALVNQGIGGNQVIGPASYGPGNAISGGPSALSRLERDVIALPGVATVIWLEGINDFGTAKAAAEGVIDGVREGVKQLRARIPGLRIVMATLTSSLHAVNNTHGTPEVEQKRQAFNAFVRAPGFSTRSWISTRLRSIPRRESSWPSSSPIHRSAVLATSSIPTGWAIRPWATPSTSGP